MIGKTNCGHILKWFWLFLPHVLTLLLAIGYLFLGGYLLCAIEGWSHQYVESNRNFATNFSIARLELDQFLIGASTSKNWSRELESFLTTYYKIEKPFGGWSLLDGFLYAYSGVTTIGYSHLYTSTALGRVFCVFYNIVGIPLCTLVLADWGLLLEEGVSYSCRWLFGALSTKVPFFRTWSSRKPLLVPAESLFCLPFVLVIFLLYVALGGLLLPMWEHGWTFVEGFYVAFDGITTIGIGDIYPRNNQYFLPTLIYTSLGIALATTAIGAIGDYLRVLHYAGTRPSDCGLEVVWFGGKHMRVEKLTQLLGKEFGATEYEIRAVQTRLDLIVNRGFDRKHSNDGLENVDDSKRGKKSRRATPRDRWNDSVITPLTLVPVQNAAVVNTGGGSFYGSEKHPNLTDQSDEDRKP